jgi:hypothetical protein
MDFFVYVLLGVFFFTKAKDFYHSFVFLITQVFVLAVNGGLLRG